MCNMNDIFGTEDVDPLVSLLIGVVDDPVAKADEVDVITRALGNAPFNITPANQAQRHG